MNSQSTNQQKPVFVKEHDEQILVVQRAKLFPDGAWQGLQDVNIENYLNIIEKEKEFLPRSIMETDTKYKQIIPYLVFKHEDQYFLMQRQSKSSEQRLKNKYSLGIGGHIRQEDIVSANIIDWAKREFEEEVNFEGTYSVKALGMLNDDSNPVGEVHVGFVLLLEGNSSKISVKSELKSGELLSLAELAPYYDSMETWTQIVFDFLTRA